MKDKDSAKTQGETPPTWSPRDAKLLDILRREKQLLDIEDLSPPPLKQGGLKSPSNDHSNGE